MPIYEYRCLGCERQFQRLILTRADEKGLSCPHCSGRDLKRLISRVAYHQSESDRLKAFDPTARQNEGFYGDTRNIGLHAKKRAQEMGVDLGSAFDAKLDKLRSDPGSVLKDGD